MTAGLTLRIQRCTRRHLLALAVLLAALIQSYSADAARPYTVDDMLRTEAIGKVRFDPGGQNLIFEHYGPFDAQSDYGRHLVIGQMRSKLYRYDLQSRRGPLPLFQQRQGDTYTLNTMSPDGRYIAFHRGSAGGLKAGVHDSKLSRQAEYDFPADLGFLVDPLWISDQVMAFPAAAPGQIPLFFSLRAEKLDRLVELWRQMRAGRQPTASVVGAGSHATVTAHEGSLVIGDAATGETTVLGQGNYPLWFPSPDGQLLAALRDRKLILDPDQRIDHGANMGGVQKSLILYELTDSNRATDLCLDCDVLQSSVNWSPDGRYMAFFARDSGQPWDEGRFRVYDREARTVRLASSMGLTPVLERGGFDMDVGSAWLGNMLAIRATRVQSGSKPSDQPRADWYILREDTQPIALTEKLEHAPSDVLAISGERLVLLSDGNAWAIDAAGNSSNLTLAVATPVRLWQHPSPYGRVPQHDLRPADIVLLQTRASDPDALERLLFLEISTGSIGEVSAPSTRSEFLAASTVTKQAAVLDSAGSTGELLIIGTDGSRQKVMEINSHLSGVAGGTPVRIDHKGPDGKDRMSWLLLPPGYDRKQPLPTVVNVYPGAGSRETWTRWELDTSNALNDHVLAGHGYAVLYPNIPVAYEDVPRDPFDGMSESVFAAVDAAAAQGLVDPDRLAVQGQSYGGYATAALIGMTDRFKAAVAQAGLYNLISMYGQFDPRLRLEAEHEGLRMFFVSLMESSQGGMGGPPWRDPERYLRNSPLMHVEKVDTPIMLIHGDLDAVPMSQAEEYFTALTRLNKDAVFVRYIGEDHVFNSPANIRDMWSRIFEWYELHLGPPFQGGAAQSSSINRNTTPQAVP